MRIILPYLLKVRASKLKKYKTNQTIIFKSVKLITDNVCFYNLFWNDRL
jgi:hypothetical protein